MIHDYDEAMNIDACEAEECRKQFASCKLRAAKSFSDCAGGDLASGAAGTVGCFVICSPLLGSGPGYGICAASCTGVVWVISIGTYHNCARDKDEDEYACNSLYSHCLKRVKYKD